MDPKRSLSPLASNVNRKKKPPFSGGRAAFNFAELEHLNPKRSLSPLASDVKGKKKPPLCRGAGGVLLWGVGAP